MTDGDNPEGSASEDSHRVTGDGEEHAFESDAERVRLLRETADQIRDDSSESRQLAAILYRVSDLYDPDEQTSPEEIYLNVRNILQVKASGGLDR